MNAFESIECAIAFDVRDWCEDRRSAWIYAIVFGWDYEDSWDEIAKKFGWDVEDRKRANMMHEQWMKAKEAKEQEVMNVDTFMQWCIDSHIIGDATVRGIKYWVGKFKEGR